MSDENSPARPALNKDRILRAAVELADRQGLDALTMRRLGAALGVEAMSLYKHVSNKDEILDGLVELVVGEIETPSNTADWRDAMRRRAVSARAALSRHSWAIGLLEARGPTRPATRNYLDKVLGNLRTAGFSIDNAAHAFWLLDSYVYGHVIQEASMTFDEIDEPTASTPTSPLADEYPNLAELEHHTLTSAFSFDTEFEFGLELVLDALETLNLTGG